MRVPEQEAREHEIQRQDKRYIEALALSIVLSMLNGYSSVYILVTLQVYSNSHKIDGLKDAVAHLHAQLCLQSHNRQPYPSHNIKNLGNKPKEFNGDQSKVYLLLMQIQLYTLLQPRTFQAVHPQGVICGVVSPRDYIQLVGPLLQ